MWISELKAGTLKVNNSNVQNTFNVKGLNSVRYANLYAKSADSKINGTDVALMKKFVYGVQTPTAKQKLVADMDKSGEIDKKDLNLLKSML